MVFGGSPASLGERGVADVSEKLYGRVTQYHAQIGHSVKKETLTQLEWNLLTEAKELFHKAEYEAALNTFTHCLAVTEKTRSSRDLAVRGAIVHNIASCLHHLGELEAAQEYYEQAIQSFKKAETPVLERLIYGNTNKRRVDFVKERLIDISWGRKPDVDKYLDENGRKRAVPVAVPNKESALSEQWDADSPPPPPWAARDEEDANEGYPYERRPAWMSATSKSYVRAEGREQTEQAAHQSSYRNQEVSEADDEGEELDDEQQERARREWLQYYLQTSEWDKASELVVTREEQEDLNYLMSRERRMKPVQSRLNSISSKYDSRAEFSELNEAAIAARQRQDSASSPSTANLSNTPHAADDEDQDMLL